MPQKRSSYKARRHTVCSSSSNPIVRTSLREGHSLLQRSKLDEIVNLNCSGESLDVSVMIIVTTNLKSLLESLVTLNSIL